MVMMTKRDRYSTIERRTERHAFHEEAYTLAAGLPQLQAKRQEYIRDLLVKALRRELDPEVLEEFIKLANVRKDVEACLVRSKLIAK